MPADRQTNRTDKQTDKHTDMLITILCTHIGGTEEITTGAINSTVGSCILVILLHAFTTRDTIPINHYVTLYHHVA